VTAPCIRAAAARHRGAAVVYELHARGFTCATRHSEAIRGNYAARGIRRRSGIARLGVPMSDHARRRLGG